MHMAITKQLTGKSLKVLNNYGTVDGKVVTKTKTYSQILPAATDEAILTVAKAFDALTSPTMEGTYVVDTNQLIEMA